MTSLPMFWIRLRKAGRGVLQAARELVVALMVVISLGLMPGMAIAAPTSLQLGIEALHQHDFAAAVKHLNRSLSEGSGAAQAYGHRCLAHLMLNRPQQASDDCTAAIQSPVNQPKLHFYRGLARYRLGKFETAIADFTEHLRSQPEDARAYYNRGLTQFARGDVAAAIVDYHQALAFAADLQPVEMSNLYNDLGIAYLSISKPREALFALDQAVAMNASDLRAYFNHGCVCHQQGKYVAALEDFDHVLKLDPNHAETYLNRGVSKHLLGNNAGAIADFRAAIEHFQQQNNAAGEHRAKLELHKLQNAPQVVA